VRIAYFHNWSWLGSAVGHALLDNQADDLWLLGGPVVRAERDPELIEHARRRGALCVSPSSLGWTRLARRLARFAPDLIVVGTFAKKLERELLLVPKIAAINIHSSFLPAYRGALPEFWVIRNGEAKTGVSIHSMNERFDAGNILVQKAFDLSPSENLLTVSMHIAKLAVPMIVELIERYRRGERPVGSPQDDAKASLAPAVRDHHLLVRWDEPAISIERLVRASFPVFEPHTRFRGERVVLRSVACAEDPPMELRPGELSHDLERQRLLAGTGDGVLSIMGLELSGVAFQGWRFAERHPMARGERLG
jgi:methionyl-tRNA formyltransferase